MQAGIPSWLLQFWGTPPLHAALCGAKVRLKTISLVQNPCRLLLSSSRSALLKFLWWQNQFVTGLSFRLLSQACRQPCQKSWQEWQQQSPSERQSKKLEAETGSSHHGSAAGMGWLEELNLLVFLILHTRGKKTQFNMPEACYQSRESSRQKFKGKCFHTPPYLPHTPQPPTALLFYYFL